MRSRLRRPSKPSVFAILMVGAAVLALLPLPWTGCANGVVQPLDWFGWTLFSGTRAARERIESPTERLPTRAEWEASRRENRELTRQVGSQQVLIAELEQVVADISGLRDQLGNLRAKIIFASVLGGDASPRRETLSISKGRRDGVQPGDWVAAGTPPEERDPDVTGRDLLLRQWLIGRVSEVQPHLSRVQLTTDPHFGLQRVWTARALANGTWEVSRRQCGLIGVGNGQMRIERAPEDYLATGYTIVLVPLAHPRPMALAIGRVVASKTLETGLHYDLQVEPCAAPRALSHVYVISVSR